MTLQENKYYIHNKTGVYLHTLSKVKSDNYGNEIMIAEGANTYNDLISVRIDGDYKETTREEYITILGDKKTDYCEHCYKKIKNYEV